MVPEWKTRVYLRCVTGSGSGTENTLKITGGVLRILKEKNLQMHENTIVRRGNVQFTAQILEET